MKQFIKSAVCVLFATIIMASLILQDAYAQGGNVCDAVATDSVIITNEKNVNIDAAESLNIMIKVCENDISIDIDVSTAAQGYLRVSYDDSFTAKAKVLIQKGETKYYYTIDSGTVNLPLQLGDGVYTVIVYKHLSGTKYRSMSKITLKVDGLLPEDVFTNSIQMADYEKYSDVIEKINKLVVNAKDDFEKVELIYGYIIRNYKYDSDKAEKLQYVTNYIPDLRDFMASGKGVCYDFASLFTAALRSNGIQAKLIMGYRDGLRKYHAWNEVFLDGKWQGIDTTWNASLTRAGLKTNMIFDTSLCTISNEY